MIFIFSTRPLKRSENKRYKRKCATTELALGATHIYFWLACAIARLELSTLDLSRADFFRGFRGHYPTRPPGLITC